jgi:hypothetical protein
MREVREDLRRRLRGASGSLGIAALAGSRIGTLTRRTRAELKRVAFNDFDRFVFGSLYQIAPGVLKALVIVKTTGCAARSSVGEGWAENA